MNLELISRLLGQFQRVVLIPMLLAWGLVEFCVYFAENWEFDPRYRVAFIQYDQPGSKLKNYIDQPHELELVENISEMQLPEKLKSNEVQAGIIVQPGFDTLMENKTDQAYMKIVYNSSGKVGAYPLLMRQIGLYEKDVIKKRLAADSTIQEKVFMPFSITDSDLLTSAEKTQKAVQNATQLLAALIVLILIGVTLNSTSFTVKKAIPEGVFWRDAALRGVFTGVASGMMFLIFLSLSIKWRQSGLPQGIHDYLTSFNETNIFLGVAGLMLLASLRFTSFLSGIDTTQNTNNARTFLNFTTNLVVLATGIFLWLGISINPITAFIPFLNITLLMSSWFRGNDVQGWMWLVVALTTFRIWLTWTRRLRINIHRMNKDGDDYVDYEEEK